MKVHIIGGGNLGVAIALGLVKFSFGTSITITRRNTESIQYLEQHGIRVSSDNTAAISLADIIILTVKPYQAWFGIEGNYAASYKCHSGFGYKWAYLRNTTRIK